jgi:hypothetical protein
MMFLLTGSRRRQSGVMHSRQSHRWSHRPHLDVRFWLKSHGSKRFAITASHRPHSPPSLNRSPLLAPHLSPPHTSLTTPAHHHCPTTHDRHRGPKRAHWTDLRGCRVWFEDSRVVLKLEHLSKIRPARANPRRNASSNGPTVARVFAPCLVSTIEVCTCNYG